VSTAFNDGFKLAERNARIEAQKLVKGSLENDQVRCDERGAGLCEFLLLDTKMSANAFIRVITEPLIIADNGKKEVEALGSRAALAQVASGYKTLVEPTAACSLARAISNRLLRMHSI